MANPRWKKILERVRGWFVRRREPEDPFAKVPVRVRRGPGGRSGAIAVAEPDE